MNFWNYYNEINGNNLDAMIFILGKLQGRVSWEIDTMKSTWNKIANAANLSSELDDELSRENMDFYALEENVSRLLKPF